MPFRLEVRVGCDDVGSRVTVRSALPDGGMGDVVGFLEACDDATFSVRDKRGALHVIERSHVVAAKVVGPPS